MGYAQLPKVEELSDRQSPPQPQSLDLNASPKQTLTWVKDGRHYGFCFEYRY